MIFHPLRPELSDRGLLEVLSSSPSGDEKGEKIVYLSKKKKNVIVHLCFVFYLRLSLGLYSTLKLSLTVTLVSP